MNDAQNVYLATVYHNGRPYAEATVAHPFILESYHYVGKSPTTMDLLREHKRKVFLDSGAFSAFTLGAEVDIDKYAKFIQDNTDVIEVASVLDGIGDPQKTWENQCTLEDKGVKVLPCYHYGEDVRYLEHYLEHYDHITIGGMVPVSNTELRRWLDELWTKHLTDERGYPRAKVHGFGMTSMVLVYRYPWFSVDSSSWVQIGAYGAIAIRAPGDRLRTVKLSLESPSRYDMGQHYDSLPSIEQAAVRAEVERLGYDIQTLREDSTERKVHNAIVYSEQGSRPWNTVCPFHTATGDLFSA